MSRSIIFDFNRTLYDPESSDLFEGVRELLENLAPNRKMILYSKKEGGRDDLIQTLNIEQYFDAIYFTEKKSAEHVREILTAHDLSPESTFIVGDLITSELAAGHEVGIDTVWFRHGKFADIVGDFEPTHTVLSVDELHALLQKLP